MGYVNNKPVGLTYSNTTNKPVGLSELSSIAVTFVSATSYSGVTLSSLGINFTGLQDNYVIVYSSATNSWQVEAQQGGGGGGSTDSFGTINVENSNSLVADSVNSQVNISSPNNTITIIADNTNKTLDFDVNEIPQTAVTNLTSDITTITNNISTIQSNVTTNSNNISTNTTNIGNLQTSVNNHFASGSVHFTVASIDHGSIAGLLDVEDHPQYASSSVSASITTNANSITSINSYIASMSGAWLSSVSSLSGQSDVQLTGTVTTGQVLKWNGTKWENGTDNTGGGGSTTFTALTDTPASYAGYANSFVLVNPGENALVFSPPTANTVVIGDATNGVDNLPVNDFLRVTLLGESTNVTTYNYSKVPSGTNVGYLWPEGTLMVYDVDTSSFNLSSPANWWSAVAADTGGLSHSLLSNLTTGNPHTQYVLTSTNSNLSALVSSIQTSTINLSSYIAANESLWASGAGNTFSSIQFITGITPTLSIGEVAWNDDYSTLDIQTSTDTTLQVGQEQVIKVRNETGSTLLNGTVVYVSGVHGTGAAKLQVGLATAQNDCSVQNIVGICTQDINHNNDGFITTFGYVNSINTSAFSVGDVVYLANTPGQYTNAQEPKPSHSIRLGTVARSHATDGVIFVKVDPGYDTTFLHNVENADPEQSGEVLIWNDISGIYQHGGHNDLADLTVGNPHTQYATLSGATFTGNISGTNIAISGTLEAATKSFLIDHPTKPDMKLRYACLEGPENGVYYRGKTESNIIELPDYWIGLVDESSISINLTPIGHIQNTLRVGSINNNTIVLHSESPINCFFIVYGTRKDVPTLQVEF